METTIEYFSLDPNDGHACTIGENMGGKGLICAIQKKHHGPLQFSIRFEEKRVPETPLVARQLRSECSEIDHEDFDVDINKVIEEYWI